MKIIIIIIIIIIYLFFCFSINIDEKIDMPIQSEELNPFKKPKQAQKQDSGDQGIQTQVNLLSTSLANTNSIALDAQSKANDILDQINKITSELKKRPV